MSGPERHQPRFVADSMVGKLARWLRLLGYDVRYERALEDAALVALAGAENRILLTRDRRLVERRACRHFLLLDSDDPWEQTLQVIRALELPVEVRDSWFRRCLECNQRLERVEREAVKDEVPPYVFANHRKFARCCRCGQVYWRGTHVDGMRSRLRELLRRRRRQESRGSLGRGVAIFLVALSMVSLWAGEEAVGSAMATSLQEETLTARRAALVEVLRIQGIADERVLAALQSVRRHRFVPESLREHAYENRPLPIGHGQTISQPYIVALMTELLEVKPGDRVLEIGTGSGYQAAVLAELDCVVYTIEIVPDLGRSARRTLERLGYENVHVDIGDGYAGWPDEAPFDRVIVTAAPEEIPKPLVEQLRVGGKMVIPVGPQWGTQYLTLLEKDEDGGVRTERILPVRFVPFVHQSR